tara:strand:+ start:319 stop:564 length:246 start_codon:yes stop_codon:yes gene_type:complete
MILLSDCGNLLVQAIDALNASEEMLTRINAAKNLGAKDLEKALTQLRSDLDGATLPAAHKIHYRGELAELTKVSNTMTVLM